MLLHAMGLEGTDAYLMGLFRASLDAVGERGCVPMMYAGVDEVLASIKETGRRVVILSSHPHQNVHAEARRYGVVSVIDQLHGGVRDKAAGLVSICRSYEADPRAVMFVGDMINDIKSGKAAGVRTVGVCTGYHTREQLQREWPDHMFDTLHDVLRLL